MLKAQAKQRVRITVLGPKSSGKTAFVFRYLARLSLSSTKASESLMYDSVYNHCVCLDHILYDLEIADLGHSQNVAMFEKSADAFIVVFSLAAREDFMEASEVCQHLRSLHPQKPILLIGNKVDLERQVNSDEGHQVNGDLFVELSAIRNDSWEVHQAMYLLLRKVSEIHRLPVTLRLLKDQSLVGSCEDSLNTTSI